MVEAVIGVVVIAVFGFAIFYIRKKKAEASSGSTTGGSNGKPPQHLN